MVPVDNRMPPLPDLPTPARMTWGRCALAVAAVAACAIGVATALNNPGHARNTVPELTSPAGRAASGKTKTPDQAPTPVASGNLPATEVYRLLSLNAGQLNAAVSTAESFTRAYGTYSYAQPASAYLARLHPYTSPTLQAQLAAGEAAPGLIRQRASEHASADAVATVASIRDIVSTTVTVIVTDRQTARAQGKTSATTAEYAVTVEPGPDQRWLVYDIEPASTGQPGTIP